MSMTKLLIIEDNRCLTSTIKDYFNSNPNIRVSLTAFNGEDGIDIISNKKDEFDMILLDLILPKKDGIKVLEFIQKIEINKPIIVLSSYNSPTVIRRVSELGATYYLLKPFELGFLEEKINNIINLSNSKNESMDLVNSNLQISISRILHELGIPSHLIGYQYIREGIIMKCDRVSDALSIKELYNEIASKYNSTPIRVERNIRHAIEISWNRGDWNLMERLFGHSIDNIKAKPTNSEYLITVAEFIKIEVF